MSAKEMVLPVRDSVASAPWQLWVSQALTVLRLELRRNFLTKRGVWIYLLAFAPVLIIGLHGFVEGRRMDGASCTVEEDTNILAGIFDVYYLRLGIFFGCMGIFTRLFRGEMVERSLHYYLLTPIRRELLVIGKFLAGVLTAMFVFSFAILLGFFFMYQHHGAAGREFVFNGPGLSHLGAYLGVTLLACFGYGAVFLLMGLLFNNPIVPAVVILLWETINSVLPSLLKKFSIIFYLKPLCPVDVPATGLLQLFSVVSDPMPAYVAVPGLLAMAFLALAATCWKIRRTEINYTTE